MKPLLIVAAIVGLVSCGPAPAFNCADGTSTSIKGTQSDCDSHGGLKKSNSTARP